MTYKQFLNKTGYKGEMNNPRYDKFSRHNKNKKTIPTRLINEWITGGYSGGSCWDDTEPTAYTSNNQKPEFTKLDNVLETVCPTISFLQYKKIKEIIHEDSRNEDEYYGNSTNYAIEYVELRELYDKLVEMNLI